MLFCDVVFIGGGESASVFKFRFLSESESGCSLGRKVRYCVVWDIGVKALRKSFGFREGVEHFGD